MINAQKNVKQVMVNYSVAAVTPSAADVITSYSQLADGELCLVNKNNVVLDGTSILTTDGIKFLIRSGTNLLTSDFIPAGTLTQYRSKVYAAATQQVEYYGFNGTSGAIDAVDYTMYTLRLNIDDHRERKTKYGIYKSLASTTQALIASSIQKNLVANLSTDKSQLITAEIITDSAGHANTFTAGNETTHLVFTKGSTYVYGSISTGVAARGSDEIIGTITTGDFIRNGTATSVGVYKIVSVTQGTGSDSTGTPVIIILDTPYQGATAITAFGSTEYVTAAEAAAANFGIKLSGVAQTYTPNVSTYCDQLVKWESQFMEATADATTFTASTAATLGNGTYPQAYEDEDFHWGNFATHFREDNWRSVATVDHDTDSAHTYDVLNLKFRHDMQSDIGPVNNSPKELTIYNRVLASGNGNPAYYAILGFLDAWVGTAGTGYNKLFSAQVGNITSS